MPHDSPDSESHAGEIGVLAQNVPYRSIFIAFAGISARSWGGGASTTYTMHQVLTSRRRWITPGQFALDLGLCRLVPGINLVALAIVTGYRLRGTLGALISAAGFMLPASLITIIITAGFSQVTSHPEGSAIVRGVVPVTAALTYSLAYENAVGVIPRRERRVVVLMSCYIAGAFVAAAVFHLSVAFIIIGGAVLGAFFFRPSEVRPRR